MKKLLLVLISIFMIMGFAGCSSSVPPEKTPEYSIELIRKAVKRHDLETFDKHVNLDKILDSSMDACFKAFAKKNNKPYERNADAEKIIAEMVQEFKPAVLTMVRGKETETSRDLAKRIRLGKDTGSVKNLYEDLEITEVSLIEKKGQTALVLIKTKGTNNVPSVNYKVSMKQLYDDTWKAEDIAEDALIEFWEGAISALEFR